jgi:hypothetical protein
MRTLAASGCPQAAELLEKADDLDEALAKDPSDAKAPARIDCHFIKIFSPRSTRPCYRLPLCQDFRQMRP